MHQQDEQLKRSTTLRVRLEDVKLRKTKAY